MCKITNDNTGKPINYLNPMFYLYCYIPSYDNNPDLNKFDYSDIYFSYSYSDEYFNGELVGGKVSHHRPKKISFVEFLEKRSDSLCVNIYATGNDNGIPNHLRQEKYKQIKIDKKILDDDLLVVPCLINTTDTHRFWHQTIKYIGFTVMSLNYFKQLPFVKKMDLDKIIKFHKENIYYVKDDDFDLIQYVSNKMTKLRTQSKYCNINHDVQNPLTTDH